MPRAGKKFTQGAKIAGSMISDLANARDLKVSSPKEAIALMQKWLLDNPNDDRLNGLMAECLANDERLEEALVYAEKILPKKKKGKITSGDEMAWFINAKILYALNRKEEALKYCEKAGRDPEVLKLKRRIEQAMDRANLPTKLALIAETKSLLEKEPAEALKKIVKADELTIEVDPEIYYLRAHAHLKLGQIKEALSVAERLCAIKPTPDYRDLVNLIRAAQKKEPNGNTSMFGEALTKAMAKSSGIKDPPPKKVKKIQLSKQGDQGKHSAIDSAVKVAKSAEGVVLKEDGGNEVVSTLKNGDAFSEEDKCLGGDIKSFPDQAEVTADINVEVEPLRASEVSNSTDTVGVSELSEEQPEKVIAVAPAKSEISQELLAIMTKAKNFVRANEMVEALALMLEIASVANESAEFHCLKSSIFLSLNKLSQAEESARKALDLEPENDRYMTHLSKVLGYSGQLEEASVFAERAAKQSSFPENFINWGEILRKLKQYKKALSVLAAAGSTAKSNTTIAYCLFSLGRIAEAVDSLDEAKKQAKENDKDRGRLFRIYVGYLFILEWVVNYINRPEFKTRIAEAVRYIKEINPKTLGNLQNPDYLAALRIIEQHQLNGNGFKKESV